MVAAIGCAFAGLCYSEFSTMIPIAGSAYTYAYATMGEFLAWIIGWDLVLEYAVGAATVSISWSAYVVSVLHDFGISLPPYLIASPWQPVQLPDGQLVHGLINLPAVFIICVISILLMIGIKESANVNAVVVVIKVTVVLVFIGVGIWFVKGANYTPFIPREHRHVRRVRLERHPAGGGRDFLRLHRLRRGLDGGAGGQEPAEGHADRHHRLADRLHDPLRRRSRW